MIIKPKNDKATLSYTVGQKTKTLLLPMGVVLQVDLDKETVIIRNFWSGAKEKWNANSNGTLIKLNSGQMDRLMNNPNYKILDKWKPCI